MAWGSPHGADSSALGPPPSLQQGKSSSTGNLLDKDDISIPPPDYGMASQAFPAQGGSTFKQRPYSVAVPAFSQVSAFEERGVLEQIPGHSPCCFGGSAAPCPSRTGWEEGERCRGCAGGPRAALQPLFVVLGLPNALWVCN